MTPKTPRLNDHNKAEYPPMHTTEHILNQTMVRMFGCERSRNAHIERKKSKCDYTLPCAPTEEQIAAMLFLWFMERNGILYRTDGSKRIADNTLVALTLMIAESRTEEKDIMVKVVVNLINQQNQ